jgi:hypothetical protein
MTDVPEVVKKKYWGDAVGLLRKTTPFLVLNVAVYAAFFLAVVVWLGIFGGLAVFFATRLEIIAWLMMFIAIAVPGGVLAFARRYILYMVQGAHIAVVTKLLLDGSVPTGQEPGGVRPRGREEQLPRRQRAVRARPPDRRHPAQLLQLLRAAGGLPAARQADDADRPARHAGRPSLLSYVDEAVLSYAIARNEPNVWRSSRHGIILYAQAYKPILGTAVRVWLMGRVVFIAALSCSPSPGSWCCPSSTPPPSRSR